jgi:hypothetical protein
MNSVCLEHLQLLLRLAESHIIMLWACRITFLWRSGFVGLDLALPIDLFPAPSYDYAQ